MTSFEAADDVLSVWADQAEALERVWHARRTVVADARSRFHGLPERALERRLEADRTELDHATMMTLLARFEGVVRSDANDRVQRRTKDAVRKPLRDLHDENPGRVRFVDLLDVWDAHIPVSAQTKSTIRRLLKHRHWLAHGRYWSDTSAVRLSPRDAHAELGDYVHAIRSACPDFPR